jgi:hypothetical protein
MNLAAASGGVLTQAPQPPAPSSEGEGEQEVRKINRTSWSKSDNIRPEYFDQKFIQNIRIIK